MISEGNQNVESIVVTLYGAEVAYGFNYDDEDDDDESNRNASDDDIHEETNVDNEKSLTISLFLHHHFQSISIQPICHMQN